LHRDNDLPARICPSGTQTWYRNGILCAGPKSETIRLGIF